MVSKNISPCCFYKIFFLLSILGFVSTVDAKTAIDPAEALQWNRVYLATYPRSGNHWSRYLIEEVTGIATGSVYCDTNPQHLKDPFPWGGFCPKNGYEHNRRYPSINDIVVIKTHQPIYNSEFSNSPYLRTIRIIRHPVDSIYSNYVHHYGNPPRDLVPSSHVDYFLKEWLAFQRYWDCKSKVVTFKYEDLLLDTENVLSQIINSIGYISTSEDIKRAVNKYPPSGYELKHLDKFKKSDLKLMREQLQYYLNKYGYEIPIDE